MNRQEFRTDSSALSVIYRDLLSLTDSVDNPRRHSKQQVRQIAKSIESFGFNVPVLIDERLQVIAGHGRLAAATLLKLSQVPTIQIAHLSEMQRRAFMIADNRLTENSSWDPRLLGEQLRVLSEANLDFSLDVLGFEMAEIDLFIEGLSEPGGAKEETCELADFGGPPTTVLGDQWALGEHRLLCGDSLVPASLVCLMQHKLADIVFTDPPFNVKVDGHASGNGKTKHREFPMASGELSEAEFEEFLRKGLGSAVEHSKRGSIHFVCMDWRHMGELLHAGKLVYSELKALCVWAKDNGGMGSLYRSQHELVFVFKNGKESHRNNIQLGKFGRYRTNVWSYPGANSHSRSVAGENLLEMHPTAKPIALVADALLDCSARGDVVLDPFLGSGTTILAAERTGRVCYGLELDPLYVDLAIRRWQRLTGGTAVHAVTGKTFADVEAAHGC